MVYLRAKKVRGRTYFYLLTGKKENVKTKQGVIRYLTKQRVIKYLGTLSGSPEEVIRKLDEAKEALQKPI